MPTLIKNREVQENPWKVVKDKTEILSTEGNIIIPCSQYSDMQDQLAARKEKGELGLLLHSDQSIDDLPDVLDGFALIAIEFPAFTDGRSYTLARELRQFRGYSGEVRAIGEVLIDQLHAMERCGFDAYELVDGKDPQKALEAFTSFTHKYQADLLINKPVYRR